MTTLIYQKYLQLNVVDSGRGTVVVDLDVTVLVTLQQTVATFVPLFPNPSSYALSTHLAHSASARNKLKQSWTRI
jgi:hypothetical protein